MTIALDIGFGSGLAPSLDASITSDVTSPAAAPAAIPAQPGHDLRPGRYLPDSRPLEGKCAGATDTLDAADTAMCRTGLSVSLTSGCEVPLDALRTTATAAVHCHPCDEAVVRLLLSRARRGACGDDLIVSPAVDPGTLLLR